MPAKSDFEKLDVFYLGRPYDLPTKSSKPGLLLYDSKDLVTHAVCGGMTGSRENRPMHRTVGRSGH